jgi:hypothetical protein
MKTIIGRERFMAAAVEALDRDLTEEKIAHQQVLHRANNRHHRRHCLSLSHAHDLKTVVCSLPTPNSKIRP